MLALIFHHHLDEFKIPHIEGFVNDERHFCQTSAGSTHEVSDVPVRAAFLPVPLVFVALPWRFGCKGMR
ncbi:hypothetical protein [Pseudomonas sp. KK4]|uniref:hypothetical protein n=1 Tax=Pseudomonas sp. KK4 TaxID=1855729 RepID=UPI0011156814|nr:hypothetical protein [Pseudomonas sp. KK4]